MSAILDKPVAPSRAPGKGGVYRRRPLDRARKMTPMGFLVLVALIYLFIMVTFVLSTMRSQQSLVRQGPSAPSRWAVWGSTGVNCKASATASTSLG